MPPRDTFGRSDKGPTRSTRTSAQIKKRGTAKAAASRLQSKIKERRKKKAREAAARQRTAEAQRANVAGAAAAQQAAARQAAQETAARQAAASKSGAQTGRGAAGQRPVTGGRGRTVERSGERAAAIARQAAARQAQARFAAQADAARKERERSAALQRAANQQRSSAISQIKAAEQSVNRFPKIKPQPKPEGMSLSRAKAGLYNLLPEFLRTDNKSGRTAEQQAFHDSIHGADARRDRRRRNKARRDQVADNVVPPQPDLEVDPGPDLPPEIIEDYEDRFPTGPGYGGGIMGGLGGFGYSPALMAYESQQGAGQVPYYMAAARNAMTPNMSPAFMHAARNYDILGGMQRTRARPIEMMSARERAEIMNMGSNFNTPNYNSPYNQFDYFRNMVGGGGGKGMGRPMPQGMASSMAGGLGAFMGGMGGMFG